MAIHSWTYLLNSSLNSNGQQHVYYPHLHVRIKGRVYINAPASDI